MPTPNATGWVRVGLTLLAVYGVLTFLGTFTHQPDPDAFGANVRYISTTSYPISHLGVSIFGTVPAIFGFIAFMAYVVNGCAGRSSQWLLVSRAQGTTKPCSKGGDPCE